jgi:3'(2'), 5'-bisphosphate nucleotidase
VWPQGLVDPLDGTREFINRNGEFTVNIALIENGSPVMGVVHLPALNETYWSDGEQAWRQDADGPATAIACRVAADDGLVVVASRSHRDERTDTYLANFQVKELISAGSSLKLCRLAEGSADLYPRLGRTMEWDIAAGHAVLAAAGGSVCTLDGKPLGYGKPGLDNPDFVARGKV